MTERSETPFWERMYDAADYAGWDTPEGRLLVALGDIDSDLDAPPVPPIDEDPVAIRLGLVPDRCPLPREETPSETWNV